MGSNPVESPELIRFMRQLLKIVQQVRGSYLHLIVIIMLNEVPEHPISWVLGVVIAKEICSMLPPYAARKIVTRFGEGPQPKSQMREHIALSLSLY